MLKLRIISLIFLSAIYAAWGIPVFAAAQQSPLYLISPKKQQNITPERSLEKLKQGNQRFVQNDMREFNFQEIVKKTAPGQYPFAVILSCMDSRNPPDVIFDQGIGNIFVIRIAGNVVNPDVLASMEYATKFVGSKIIVVMGHTACGAVGAASCGGAVPGNLPELLKKITPAVKTITAKQPDQKCTDPNLINEIAKQNVLDQMQYITKQSPIIANLLKENKIMLVGAMQELATGKVEFFDANGNLL